MTIRTDMDKGGETRLAAKKGDNASSGIWARLKESLAVGALVLAAGCGPAVAQQHTSVPIQTAQGRTEMILVAGETPGGQTAIAMQGRVQDGEYVVTATANIAPGNYVYDWLIYQDISRYMEPFLLNPRHRTPGELRYIGIVVRGADITDGTQGDFVVRVRRERSGESSVLQYRPVVEQDGSIRPENVLYRLQPGTLRPVLDNRFSSHVEEISIVRDTPQATFVSYGEATPVVVIDDRLDVSRASSVTAGVISASIVTERRTQTNQDGNVESMVTFTGRDIMIMQRGRPSMLLPEYEAENGRLNLTYYWFMFQAVQPHWGPLLLNPQYRDPSQPRYIGMLVRGIVTTDGGIGDYVVRVRRTDGASGTPEWAPIIGQDGRVSPENILFRMTTGTTAPEVDFQFQANLRSASFMGQSNMVSVVEYGPTTPVVIVDISEKRAGADAVSSRTTTTIAPRQ